MGVKGVKEEMSRGWEGMEGDYKSHAHRQGEDDKLRQWQMQIRYSWLRSDISVCGCSTASSEHSSIPHLTLATLPNQSQDKPTWSQHKSNHWQLFPIKAKPSLHEFKLNSITANPYQPSRALLGMLHRLLWFQSAPLAFSFFFCPYFLFVLHSVILLLFLIFNLLPWLIFYISYHIYLSQPLLNLSLFLSTFANFFLSYDF